MNTVGEISPVAAVLTSILLIGGAGVTLIGALGLIRLRDSFYQRVHAPTLGTTLGTACVALASMIYFSALEGRLAAHELLIVVFITATTPISLMVLVRAAVLRDALENNRGSPEENERR
jgi:multicomponent K+:H+ antiporter subunit G